MDTKNKLALSARPGKLALIREGMFLRCYQQSLFSLVHSVYPDIKITGRRIRKLNGQEGVLRWLSPEYGVIGANPPR